MNTVNGIMSAMPYLCVESSRGLNEILSRPVVIFDLSTLTNNVRKKYLVLLTLAHLLHSRSSGTAWGTVVAVDEVHHLASTELTRKLEDAEPYFTEPRIPSIKAARCSGAMFNRSLSCGIMLRSVDRCGR